MNTRFTILFMFYVLINYAQSQDSSFVMKEIDSWVNLGRKQLSQKKMDSAIITLNLADEKCQKRFGPQSYCNALILFNRARISHAYGDLISADSLYELSKQTFEISRATNTVAYAECLNNLALRNSEKGNFDISEKYYLQIKDIQEQLGGKNSPAFAKILTSLGLFYQNTGRYKEVEPLFIDAIRIYQEVNGKLNKETINAMNNLGGYYLSQDKLERAESIYLEVMDLREKLLGRRHVEYIKVLSNLGRVYHKRCDYEVARDYYERGRNLLLESGQESSMDYAMIMNNIGILFMDIGDFKNAEAAYIKSKELRLKLFGRNNINYANILNNLGTLYEKLNNLEKAEVVYLDALDIRTNLLGKDHPDRLESLINMGGIYKGLKNYEKAEMIYKEALNLVAKLYGKEHNMYAIFLVNLSGLYLSLLKFSEAEKLSLEAKSILEKTIGKSHPDYAACINGLADIYASDMKQHLSTPLYLEAKEIREKTLGRMHPEYANSLSSLAMDYSEAGNYNKAETYFEERSLISNKILINSLGYLSENELRNYLSKFISEQEQLLYYMYANKVHNPSFRNLCYNNDLIYKAFLLNSSFSRNKEAMGDTLLRYKMDSIAIIKRLLSREFSKPISEQNDINKLEELSNSLEKEIANNIGELGNKIYSVQDIRANLKDGEAAINFVRFAIPKEIHEDSIIYAAFVVLKNEPDLHFICLFEERQLKNILAKENLETLNPDFLYAASSDFRGGQLLDQPIYKGSIMYDMIWRPIDSLLQGVKKIYLSPIGLLHRVSFAALPTRSTKLLSNQYDLHIMGSTKSITERSELKFNKNFEAVIFGGANYDIKTDNKLDTLFALEQNQSDWIHNAAKGSEKEGGFHYLSGTVNEANSLGKLLIKEEVSTNVFMGDSATEDQLKQLGSIGSKSPNVLHIASHGYYFPKPSPANLKNQENIPENAFIWSNNPLQRSGLILAGANSAWRGEKVCSSKEDGILTALEISNLNLSNTNLIVLSACETALGDIEGIEGVYGLQRAFKMAGVKYMLLSLWKVPDMETSEFMHVFYKSWLKDKTDIHKSFKIAQKKMHKRYKDASKWGAWVLIE